MLERREEVERVPACQWLMGGESGEEGVARAWILDCTVAAVSRTCVAAEEGVSHSDFMGVGGRA